MLKGLNKEAFWNNTTNGQINVLLLCKLLRTMKVYNDTYDSPESENHTEADSEDHTEVNDPILRSLKKLAFPKIGPHIVEHLKFT